MKPAVRAAGAKVVAPQFFDEDFISVNYAEAALDARFRGEPFTPLRSADEKRTVLRWNNALAYGLPVKVGTSG